MKSIIALYLHGGNLAKLELENAMLIFKGWLDASAKLFVNASSPSFDVRSTFSIVEVTETGILLKASDGDTQLSIGLANPDIKFGYFEPREFSDGDEEFGALLASLPDPEKFRSAIGIWSFGRVTAPSFADLLVPFGKVVLMALWD
jgi:hypothetical protein